MHSTQTFRQQAAPRFGPVKVEPVRFIRLREVRAITGLSRSQIYRLESEPARTLSEAQMAPGARYATCKPWASKTPEQCLRIAGVLSIVENPGASMIEAATLERAAELALWHLDEALRLAGTAELSPEIRNAEALLDCCHATGRKLLHSRAALRLGPARIRDRAAFGRAMAELARAGWAEPVENGAELDARHRRHVWRILPHAEDC